MLKKMWVMLKKYWSSPVIFSCVTSN